MCNPGLAEVIAEVRNECVTDDTVDNESSALLSVFYLLQHNKAVWENPPWLNLVQIFFFQKQTVT